MYEIAKELGVPSKDLLAKLSSMGVEAKSHSSTVSQDVADKLRSSAGGGRQARAGQSRQDQGDARPAQGRTGQGSGQAGQALVHSRDLDRDVGEVDRPAGEEIGEERE